MAKATQTQRILDYIREFGSITAIDAVRDLGVMRLAARVSDLKKRAMTLSVNNRQFVTALEKRAMLQDTAKGVKKHE